MRARVSPAVRRILERLCGGGRIKSRRQFPLPPVYTLTGCAGLPPERVDEQRVHEMVQKGLIVGKPIDGAWDAVDFIVTGQGVRALSNPEAPALPPRRAPVRLFAIPPGTREAACRRCHAPIYWITHPATGRPHPVSVAPAKDERCERPSGTTWGHGISHFDDCPFADEFRRSP
jgi:hypothetical protein